MRTRPAGQGRGPLRTVGGHTLTARACAALTLTAAARDAIATLFGYAPSKTVARATHARPDHVECTWSTGADAAKEFFRSTETIACSSRRPHRSGWLLAGRAVLRLLRPRRAALTRLAWERANPRGSFLEQIRRSEAPLLLHVYYTYLREESLLVTGAGTAFRASRCLLL